MSLSSRWMWPLTAASILMITSAAAAAESSGSNPPRDERELVEVVVTALRMVEPLVVSSSAKAPRQPLPAHDGADFLKTVPGFSVIRKGGTDGDPVFRGMAASRVNIEIDGEQILGGCGMRMDPPTAYVFPEAYDRIIVIKGPQTVLHGPGNSAASVSFERRISRFDEPGFEGRISALGASFGRNDVVGELRAGMPKLDTQLTATRAESDDFTDGNGRDVHSAYRRWSTNAALGWTPDDDTRIDLTGARSDGEAAYADRMMDGVLFARDNLGLRFERRNLSPRVRRLEAQTFYNYIDHVMDNYSLRTFVPTTMMPGRAVSNPDRRTTGSKLEMEIGIAKPLIATIGLERQENRHTLRSTMNETMMPYEAMARVEDGRFRSDSLYAELTWQTSERQRLIGGLRADDWSARDGRQRLALGMTSVVNPTAGAERSETLGGGFIRFESDLASQPATLYAGLGRVQRFPDYWELISAGKESEASVSAFNTLPEKTTQFDAGILLRRDRLSFSLSGFVSDVDDYILIQSNYAKGMRMTTVVRNVEARTWGGEADATFTLNPAWKVTGTLAYTRGDNRSDGTALAQMAPLESRLALDYSEARWSAGALLRIVAAQDRFVLNQGNIVGQDIGGTPGFAVLSLNGGWQPRSGWQVTAGIDNLFDRAYAEHLSRSGAMVSGFLQSTRVNEPGRTAWLKVSAEM
jgi:iron complex outermembrane receptor protein